MSKCEEVKTATETRKLNDTKKKRRVKATNQDTEPVPTTNQKTKTLNKIRGCETAFLPMNTIGVPQMYHWTANCSITVNRRFGVSLQPSTQEVDIQAAGRSGRVRRVFSRTLRDSGLFVECQSERDGGQGCARARTCTFYLRKLRTVQRFVSSHVGSFMLFNTRLTTFSRSLRALCSSSSDLFIFLLSCQVEATYVQLFFFGGGDCGL